MPCAQPTSSRSHPRGWSSSAPRSLSRSAKPWLNQRSPGGPRRGRTAALALGDAAERRQRLPHHLVHVVIAVGRQPPDESDVALRQRERLVALVQRLVLGPGHRIVGIAVGPRKFIGDGGLGAALAGDVLVLA